MNRSSVLALGGAVLALTSVSGAPSSVAVPTAAFELEHARANARAGGPISDYDAELLERWGNSSGGPDWRKQYRAQKGFRDEPVRAYRHKNKSRGYND